MGTGRHEVRAAVTQAAFRAVRERAPAGAEVIALDDGVDLHQIDFLVPASRDQRALEALAELDRLAVIQVLSAGTDWIEDRAPDHVTLCNARGARDGAVAEWILAALLGASSGLLACAQTRRWHRRTLAELGGWTVVIVGMGSIGGELARYLRPVGTRVIGVGSHAHDGLYGPDQLLGLLGEADAVVVLAPLTDATRAMIAGDELAALPDGAVLINAARGAVVDADALLGEVQTGRLRAVLDVTDPEPLPDDHPLWRAPGVLAISPHIAGDSPAANARAAALAGDQLARWCAGEALINVVRTGLARGSR